MQSGQTIFLIGLEATYQTTLMQYDCMKQRRVCAFADAESFLAQYLAPLPGCLILEQDLPGMSGLELQQKLTENLNTNPIIFLSNIPSMHIAVKAMENGALTFLEKPANERVLCPYVIKALHLAEERHHQVLRSGELREKFALLTPDERRILEFILDGLPNKSIAIKLDIGLRTVELRRSSVMKKINASSFSELIRLSLLINFPHDQQNRN
jgi:FixJ family two-component response regulator